MKKLIMLTIAMSLVACKDTTVHTPERVIEIVKEVPTEVPVEVPVEHETLFSGYYNLDGGSDLNCIYLDEKAPNVIDLESDCQSLVTVNPENSTLGQFPVLNATNLLVSSGKVQFTRDITYTAGHDIEEDASGIDILGKRRTDVTLKLVDEKLVITIKIYANANNNNLNFIVAERVFNEL